MALCFHSYHYNLIWHTNMVTFSLLYTIIFLGTMCNLYVAMFNTGRGIICSLLYSLAKWEFFMGEKLYCSFYFPSLENCLMICIYFDFACDMPIIISIEMGKKVSVLLPWNMGKPTWKIMNGFYHISRNIQFPAKMETITRLKENLRWQLASQAHRKCRFLKVVRNLGI